MTRAMGQAMKRAARAASGLAARFAKAAAPGVAIFSVAIFRAAIFRAAMAMAALFWAIAALTPDSARAYPALQPNVAIEEGAGP